MSGRILGKYEFGVKRRREGRTNLDPVDETVTSAFDDGEEIVIGGAAPVRSVIPPPLQGE